MVTSSRPAAELGTAFDRAQLQFKGLNPQEPGQWPLLPKMAAWAGAVAAAVVAGWFLLLSGAAEQLQAARDRDKGGELRQQGPLPRLVGIETSELRRGGAEDRVQVDVG